MSSALRTITVICVCLLSLGSVRGEWKKYQSGTMAWLHSIHFADENKGWIGGSRGTLLKTDDGGRTWAMNPKLTQDTIRDVYFSDPLHGWLLCEGSIFGPAESISYLMVTHDGGQTWQRKEAFKGRDRVVRMFFMNSRFGCAVGEGGSVWCTVENEEAWRKYPLPVRYLMLDGRILGGKSLVLVGGGGTALRTDDWGANWVVASTPGTYKSKVNSLFFTDDMIGWAVGAKGKILFTKNGGQTWSIQNTPVNEELTDIVFHQSGAGYAVGDSGAIIRTSNSGFDWALEPSGTKHRLEAVTATKRRAFAVGFGGTILVNDFDSESDRRMEQ